MGIYVPILQLLLKKKLIKRGKREIDTAEKEQDIGEKDREIVEATTSF